MDAAPVTLCARIRDGDRVAFAELVRVHERRLYGIAMGMTRNPEDARDILQDTLVSAWRSIGSLQDDTRLEAWLCRIAANSARMLLRTRRRRPTVELTEEQFDAAGHRLTRTERWPTPEDELARARLAGRIGELALELPDDHREVWVLADLEQLSMVEIAEVLHLTVPNVKTRLHRARLTLRARLAEEVR